MNSSINTVQNLTSTAVDVNDNIGRQNANTQSGIKRSVHVLIAHEDPAQANQIKSTFKDAGWMTHAHRITSVEDLDESLSNGVWNIILAFGSSKMYLPAVIGNYIEKNGAEVHAIFLDDKYSPTNAIQIVQCGFRDYLTVEEQQRLLFVADREIKSQADRRLASTANEVLAEANARSQLLMDSTAEAIAYVTDGMIVHANSVFAEQLKFDSADDLDCMPFIDLVAAKDQIVLKPLLRQYQLGGEEETSVEIEALGADSDPFKVELSLALASYEGEACTQVILRPAVAKQQSSGESLQTSNNNVEFDINTINSIEGKGSLFFASITSNAVQRKKLGLSNHLKLISEISSLLRDFVPPEASVFDYLKESWVIVIPNSHPHEPTELADQLCKLVNSKSVGEESKNFTTSIAVGISKYGVADISIEGALNRAFKASAEKQLDGESGYKMFVPKIDNAEGAAALQSALELKRFKLKYQPIIALQNQEKHFYDAVLHIENDAGRDDDAEKLLASLGIEKTNAELDRWIITETTNTLKPLIESNKNIQLNISLTASAIMDDTFYSWLSTTIQLCQLPKASVSFSLKAADAADYEKNAAQLIAQLRDNDYKVCLSNTNVEHLEILKTLQPTYIKLSSELTEKMSGEEADPELIKNMIRQASELDIQCIASGVNSAGELAQLWQTGVPFVQGSYLQVPLANMDYEFSDIA